MCRKRSMKLKNCPYCSERIQRINAGRSPNRILNCKPLMKKTIPPEMWLKKFQEGIKT